MFPSSEKMNSEDAEILKRFSQELASLYESKPPVSKAKMVQLTKVAMKGIKFYKHVVMAVEKFIHRCKPEYKLPGLYVIDSIVRQSKHQFGAEKDLFAPRFGKNLNATLQAACQCSEDDKTKVVRILNIWMQSSVFDEEFLKPTLNRLLNGSATEDLENIDSADIISPVKKHETSRNSSKIEFENENIKSDQKSDGRKKMGGSSKPTPPTPSSNPENLKVVDPGILQHIQKLTSTIMTQHHRKSGEADRKLTKRILAEYEYSDDEEESLEEDSERGNTSLDDKDELSANLAAATQSLLNNPQILQQIQKMQQSLRTPPVVPPKSATVTNSSAAVVAASPLPRPPTMSTLDARSTSSSSRRHIQPPQTMVPTAPVNPPVLPVAPPPPVPVPSMNVNGGGQRLLPASIVDFSVPPPGFERQKTAPAAQVEIHPQIPSARPFDSQAMNCPPPAEPLPPGFGDGAAAMSVPPAAFRSDRDDRRRTDDSSRDYSSSGRRKHRSRDRSRSKSRDRKRKRKSRSRSRDKHRRRSRSKEDRKDNAGNRERKNRGMVPVKPRHVSIYSRTLWFGRVPPSCEADEIKSALKDYGEPVSIDIIPPRGCAYIVMPDRKSAVKVLDRLKDLKIQHRILKMAWAPGKGIKNEFNDEWDWDVDNGVSSIAWEKIFAAGDVDLTPYIDGGMLDVESLPDNVRNAYDVNGKISSLTSTSVAALTLTPLALSMAPRSSTSAALTLAPGVPSLPMQAMPLIGGAAVGGGQAPMMFQPFGAQMAPHSMMYPSMQGYSIPPPAVFSGQQPPGALNAQHRLLTSAAFHQMPPVGSPTGISLAAYGKMGPAPPLPFGAMRMPPPGFPLLGGRPPFMPMPRPGVAGGVAQVPRQLPPPLAGVGDKSSRDLAERAPVLPPRFGADCMPFQRPSNERMTSHQPLARGDDRTTSSQRFDEHVMSHRYEHRADERATSQHFRRDFDEDVRPERRRDSGGYDDGTNGRHPSSRLELSGQDRLRYSRENFDHSRESRRPDFARERGPPARCADLDEKPSKVGASIASVDQFSTEKFKRANQHEDAKISDQSPINVAMATFSGRKKSMDEKVDKNQLIEDQSQLIDDPSQFPSVKEPMVEFHRKSFSEQNVEMFGDQKNLSVDEQKSVTCRIEHGGDGSVQQTPIIFDHSLSEENKSIDGKNYPFNDFYPTDEKNQTGPFSTGQDNSESTVDSEILEPFNEMEKNFQRNDSRLSTTKNDMDEA